MTLEGQPSIPPASTTIVPPANTTIVYAHQKSGGPRVFGALAMLLGAIGALSALLSLAFAGNFSGQPYSWWNYISPIFGGLAAVGTMYTGFLLWNYSRRYLLIGFGTVGIFVLNGILGSIIESMRLEESVEGLGAAATAIGISGTVIGAFCCGVMLILPIFMNGNDFENE